MIKISNVVEEILREDDIAFLALKAGTLNTSAYAANIRGLVEKRTKKPIKNITAITMALSRVGKKLKTENLKLPDISLLDLEIKKHLTEIVFSKTRETIKQLQKIFDYTQNNNQFFTMNVGQSEISVIISDDLVPHIKKANSTKPVAELTNLVCLTFHTEVAHMNTPNIFYSILRRLATKKINIIEILTTHSEISLLIEEKYLQDVHRMLFNLLK